MMFEVFIAEQAELDLRGIYDYITYELKAPEHAVSQLDRLEKKILSLDFMPEKYRKYEHPDWVNRNLHIMPVDHYCVFYIIDLEDRIVNILRIIYGARDLRTQLSIGE